MDKFAGLCKGKKGIDEVRDSDMVRDSNPCIERKTMESVYSWDSKGAGKTEKVDNRSSV